MSLAAKKIPVSLPIGGFKTGFILFQIITYEHNGVAEQMFIITPQMNTDANERKYILVGASMREAHIHPLDLEQVERGLILTGERLLNTTTNDPGIEFDDIAKAIACYRTIPVNTLCDGNIIIPLSGKISALINKVKSDPEYLDVIVNFGGILVKPKLIEFVGYTSGDDLLRISINKNDLDKNSAMIHLLDDVKIFVDRGTGLQLEYAGDCIKFTVVNNEFIFEISRYHMYNMKNSPLNYMTIKNINPQNIFYYISRGAGVNAENIKIQGFENRQTQVYTIIIPISYLKVEESIGIGKVSFYSPLKDLEETRRIESIIDVNSEIWDSASRAKVHVQADNPYDAYTEGKEQIELALSILMHLVRSDSIHQGYSVLNEPVDWNREFFNPKPKISSWVYIFNASTCEQIVHNTEEMAQFHTFVLDKRLEVVMNNLGWYESLQFKLQSSDCTKKERKTIKALFDSLNWLRRSWDAEAPEDQIIYANMAMEFIVNTERGQPVIPRDQNDNVVAGALNNFQDNFKGSEDETEKYIIELKEKLTWALGEASTMGKAADLIKRLNIPVREQDFKLLKEMRIRRNDIIHGRPMNDFSKEDLWRLNQVISSLAAYKFASLGGNSNECN